MALLPTNKGSLMIEICIALALFTLILSYTSLSFSGITLSSVAIQKSREALYKNKELLVDAVIQEKTVPHSIHSEGVSTKDITQCRKLLSVDDLSTVVTYPSYDKAIGYDCGGTEPAQTVFTLKNTLPTFASTTSLDVIHGKAYITASSTDLTQPSLYIADVTPSSPSLLSSVTTGSGINTIDVTQEYAYLAAKGTTTQFQIVDVRDPSHPHIISKKTLPGVAGEYPSAISIFYYDSKVYIGTHRTAGREFHVYDVSTPNNPQWLGSLEINHNINDISVRGDYAYLATSGNTKDIIILNISNPSAITIASSFSFIGNEDTWSIFHVGNRLYAGRAKTTDATHHEIIILNMENILEPTVIGAFRVGAKINSLKVVDDILFTSMTTSATKSGFYSLPVSTIASSTLTTLQTSKIPIVDIDLEDGVIYTLSQDGIISLYAN